MNPLIEPKISEYNQAIEGTRLVNIADQLVKLPTADNTTDELPFQHGLEAVTSTPSPFPVGSGDSTPDRNNVTKMTGQENVPTTSIRQPILLVCQQMILYPIFKIRPPS